MRGSSYPKSDFCLVPSRTNVFCNLWYFPTAIPRVNLDSWCVALVQILLFEFPRLSMSFCRASFTFVRFLHDSILFLLVPTCSYVPSGTCLLDPTYLPVLVYLCTYSTYWFSQIWDSRILWPATPSPNWSARCLSGAEILAVLFQARTS